MKAFPLVLGLLILYACGSSAKLQNRAVSDSRSQVVLEARAMIGSPYRYGGINRSGFDCSGLMKYAFAKVDISLTGGSRHIIDQVQKINEKDILTGDLVFFTLGSRIDHIALISKIKNDGTYIIHSTSSKGVIEQNFSQSSYWTNKFHSYGRIIRD